MAFARLLASAAAVLTAPSVLPGLAAAAVTIPFDGKANQIAVEATVRGEPLTLLVDTAVTPSVIDVSVATSLGLRASETPSGQASGTGGEAAAFYAARLHDVQLGALNLDHIDAVAFDMRRLSEKFGRPLHGILGENFLAGRILVIDYESHKLTIFRSSRDARRSVARCSLRYHQRLAIVTGDVAPKLFVSVEGVRVPVSLDTGSALGLELYDGALPARGVGRLLTHRMSASVIGARGEAAVQTAILQGAVRLGPFRWVRPKVVLSGPKGSPDTRLGNLGNAFLQGKTLLLDYAGRELGLYQRCGKPT